MFLEHLPGGGIVPAIARPEPIAGDVVGVDEDVAARDVRGGESREAVLDQPATDTGAALRAVYGEMIERAAATIVAAENRADDPSVRRDGERAEARIALQERFDGFPAVGFVEPEPVDAPPQLQCSIIIGCSEGTDLNGSCSAHSASPRRHSAACTQGARRAPVKSNGRPWLGFYHPRYRCRRPPPIDRPFGKHSMTPYAPPPGGMMSQRGTRRV